MQYIHIIYSYQYNSQGNKYTGMYKYYHISEGMENIKGALLNLFINVRGHHFWTTISYCCSLLEERREAPRRGGPEQHGVTTFGL